MTTFLLVLNSWKKLQKIHSKKAINKKGWKNWVFDYYYCVETILQLFGVNNFPFFNRSKYASNFLFFYTHIEILHKQLYLYPFSSYEAKRGPNGSQNETLFSKCVLEFLFASISGLGASILVVHFTWQIRKLVDDKHYFKKVLHILFYLK